MSDPRAIAQVTTAASALEGAGVTMDASNASLFTVGQLVELYPSQYGDGAPLARAGQTVRYQITGIAGLQLTGNLNYDLYPNPPQVEKGWIIDGRAGAGGGAAGDASGKTRYVDGVSYPRTWQGIYDAAAVGAGKVLVSPGAAIPFSATPPTGGYIPFVDGLDIDLQGTEITMVAHANPIPFTMSGGGPSGTGRPLNANALKGQVFVQLTTANINLLIADGMADGSLVVVYQDCASVADAGTASDTLITRVWSIDAAAGAVYITPSLMKPFTLALNAKLRVFSTVKRCALRNARLDGARINQPGGIFAQVSATEDCVLENLSSKNHFGALVDTTYGSYNLSARKLSGVDGQCGIDQAAVHLGYLNNSRAEDIDAQGYVGIGFRVEGGNHNQYKDIRVFSGASRATRLLHQHMCVGDGFLPSSTYGNPPGAAGTSGFTLAGDSEDNVFTGIVAVGSNEAGILVTHVLGSTFTNRNNYFQGRAVGNYRDISLSGDCNDNDFDVKATLLNESSNDIPLAGNSFGDDFVIAYPYAAGTYGASGGQTWAPGAAQVTTHNYIQRRKRMVVTFVILAGAAPSGACLELRQLIPNGRVADGNWRSWIGALDNGVIVPAQIVAADTVGYFAFTRLDGVNWTGAGPVTLVGEITLGVT